MKEEILTINDDGTAVVQRTVELVDAAETAEMQIKNAKGEWVGVGQITSIELTLEPEIEQLL